jgi:Immunity protein 45
MKWVSLFALKSPDLGRGTRFRFPADYPYEEVVEFLLFDTPYSPSGHGLLVISGYKAGLINLLLPEESKSQGNFHSISTGWMKKNFRKWVWDVSTKKVFVSLSQAPVPRLPKASD